MMSEDTRRTTITIAPAKKEGDLPIETVFIENKKTRQVAEMYAFYAQTQGLKGVKYPIPLRIEASKIPDGIKPELGGVYDVVLQKGKPTHNYDPANPDPPDFFWFWNIAEWLPAPAATAPVAPAKATNGATAPAQARQMSHTEARALDEWHKDRRTALMYSVEYMKIEAKDAGHEQNLAEIREGFWRWLRQEDGSVMPEEEKES